MFPLLKCVHDVLILEQIISVCDRPLQCLPSPFPLLYASLKSLNNSLKCSLNPIKLSPANLPPLQNANQMMTGK